MGTSQSKAQQSNYKNRLVDSYFSGKISKNPSIRFFQNLSITFVFQHFHQISKRKLKIVQTTTLNLKALIKIIE